MVRFGLYSHLLDEATACGILYAYDIFEFGAISQLITNVILGLAIVVGGARFGAGSLLAGILGGAFISTLIYSVKLAAVRREFGPKRRLLRVDFRSLSKAFKIAAPLIGSVVAGQSTSIVVNRALSRLPVGSLAAFGYAWKMGLLVQLMPNALATVLFPKFSATWYSTKNSEEFGEQCARALRTALFIALPLTCICWMTRVQLVTFFFQRGAFTLSDVHAASALFGLIILNGPAASVSVSLARAFYAIQAARFPVMMDISASCLELFFVPLLTSKFGVRGAAFAYSLLPWITGIGLLRFFKSCFASFPLRNLSVFALKASLIAVPSAWLGERVGGACASLLPAGAVASAFSAGLSALLALALYYEITLLLSFPEATAWNSFIRKTARLLLSRVG